MILNKYFQSIADLNDMNEIESVYSNMPEDLDILDDDLNLEMEKLRLIEAQIVYKQRLRSFAVAERKNAESSSGRNVRHMASDGTIVVQSNGLDAPSESVNLDRAIPRSSGTLSSSLKTALCMTCNAVTSLSCAKCRATPYCSDICCERDTTRHRGHCSVTLEFRKTKSDSKDSKTFKSPSVPGNNTQNKTKIDKTIEKNNSGSSSSIPPIRQPKMESRNDDENRVGHVQENRMNGQHQNRNHNSPRSQMGNRPKQSNYERNNDQKPRTPTNHVSGNSMPVEKPISNETKAPVQTKPVQPAPIQSTSVKPAPVKPVAVQPATTKPVPAQSALNKIKKTITEPLSPKHYIIEKLKAGDQVVLNVESTDESNMIPSGSMLCLAIHEDYSDSYTALFDELIAVCDGDSNEYSVTPGNSCCVKSEDAWYRARCLNQTQLALLDAAKIITRTNQPIRKLPEKYHNIVEFCCLLQSGVKCEHMIGTIKERNANGSVGVELINADDGSMIGNGSLTRWLPECTIEVIVENTNAEKAKNPKGAKEVNNLASQEIPTPPRPDLKNSTQAVIVHVESLNRIVLLPCDEQTRRQYDNLLHRGALFAQSASPMKVPAVKGQLVLAKYTDGVHYRALVTRTNVALNKYRLEYIEFGNFEISSLERLVECPPELSLETEPSLITIAAIKTDYPETKKALDYLNQLKDKTDLVIVSLENCFESVPAGSFVNLTLEATREDINRAVSRLCTPQWKIMEEKGQTIVDSEIIMEDQLSIAKLKPEGGLLRILDSSMLEIGRVACSPMSDTERAKVMENLLPAMEAYANSNIGKAQYLPRYRELCIAQHESCWHRALFCDQTTPGSDTVFLLLVDSGALVNVPATHVRKMLREFIEDLPAHAVDVYIRDWPTELSPEKLSSAKQYLKIKDGEENGVIKVTNCVLNEDGSYAADDKGLLDTIKQ